MENRRNSNQNRRRHRPKNLHRRQRETIQVTVGGQRRLHHIHRSDIARSSTICQGNEMYCRSSTKRFEQFDQTVQNLCCSDVRCRSEYHVTYDGVLRHDVVDRRSIAVVRRTKVDGASNASESFVRFQVVDGKFFQRVDADDGSSVFCQFAD